MKVYIFISIYPKKQLIRIEIMKLKWISIFNNGVYAIIQM